MFRKKIKNKEYDNPEKDKDPKKEDIYKLSDSLFNATLHIGAFNCISELSSLLYKNGYIKDFLDKLFYNILYSYNISIGQIPFQGPIDINQIMESSYRKEIWDISMKEFNLYFKEISFQLLDTIVLTPLGEELIFRGIPYVIEPIIIKLTNYIYKQFDKRQKYKDIIEKTISIIIMLSSSFLFALIHVDNYKIHGKLDILFQVFNCIILGIILYCITKKYGLTRAIFHHMIFNFVGVFESDIPKSILGIGTALYIKNRSIDSGNNKMKSTIRKKRSKKRSKNKSKKKSMKRVRRIK